MSQNIFFVRKKFNLTFHKFSENNFCLFGWWKKLKCSMEIWETNDHQSHFLFRGHHTRLPKVPTSDDFVGLFGKLIGQVCQIRLFCWKISQKEKLKSFCQKIFFENLCENFHKKDFQFFSAEKNLFPKKFFSSSQELTESPWLLNNNSFLSSPCDHIQNERCETVRKFPKKLKKPEHFFVIFFFIRPVERHEKQISRSELLKEIFWDFLWKLFFLAKKFSVFFCFVKI